MKINFILIYLLIVNTLTSKEIEIQPNRSTDFYPFYVQKHPFSKELTIFVSRPKNEEFDSIKLLVYGTSGIWVQSFDILLDGNPVSSECRLFESLSSLDVMELNIPLTKKLKGFQELIAHHNWPSDPPCRLTFRILKAKMK